MVSFGIRWTFFLMINSGHEPYFKLKCDVGTVGDDRLGDVNMVLGSLLGPLQTLLVEK
jgi:hypothetical protein